MPNTAPTRYAGTKQRRRAIRSRSLTLHSSQTYCDQYCVDVGFYVFKISDLFKDGMCCAAGNGSYSIEVMKKNGQYRQAASGGSFGSNMSHVIDVGHTESKMTDRDEQYLVAHNKRRREWHARYGKEFRPLVWSNGLKESAMIYATKLLDDCTSGPPGKVDSDTFQMGSFSSQDPSHSLGSNSPSSRSRR